MSAPELVARLVSGQGLPLVASAADLRAHLVASHVTDTVEQAALGGRSADELGWAFACGYQAALQRVPGTRAEGQLLSLAATEEGGGHPRAIRTALTPRPDGDWELSGDKAWVTLGTDADVLIVVATTGQDERGRNRLRAARFPSTRAGVTLEPGAALPFAPEIAHARLKLRGVQIAADELLAGDGYDELLKPFRTIEDTHVVAAALGWAIGVGQRSGWERGWTERAAAVVVALRGIGHSPASDAGTHVALAGALEQARSLLTDADWPRAPEATRVRWERDRPLLDVARNVRAARLEAAWRTLSGS